MPVILTFVRLGKEGLNLRPYLVPEQELVSFFFL